MPDRVTELYVKPPLPEGVGIVGRIAYWFATPDPLPWPKRFVVEASDGDSAIVAVRRELARRGYVSPDDYTTMEAVMHWPPGRFTVEVYRA